MSEIKNNIYYQYLQNNPSDFQCSSLASKNPFFLPLKENKYMTRINNQLKLENKAIMHRDKAIMHRDLSNENK